MTSGVTVAAVVVVVARVRGDVLGFGAAKQQQQQHIDDIKSRMFVASHTTP